MPVPNTKVRTTHSLAIRVNGVTVGLIQNWNVDQSRAITPVYEINPLTSGRPIESVPGNETGLTITVTRVDLYNRKMEEAFGVVDIAMLTNQTNPFEMYEVWLNPDGTSERFTYYGCWFSRISRRMDVTGHRMVIAEGTINYTSRERG